MKPVAHNVSFIMLLYSVYKIFAFQPMLSLVKLTCQLTVAFIDELIKILISSGA